MEKKGSDEESEMFDENVQKTEEKEANEDLKKFEEDLQKLKSSESMLERVYTKTNDLLSYLLSQSTKEKNVQDKIINERDGQCKFIFSGRGLQNTCHYNRVYEWIQEKVQQKKKEETRMKKYCVMSYSKNAKKYSLSILWDSVPIKIDMRFTHTSE
ncbi:hypothetical protein RFI_39826 [Reticulomyxa filosa]|uniref:Uncharacterized protein n=1 Tax=Reticulomyxa filosa TaxID=46433 RepID=X6L986_RETFI|nr:hypothetical protein RFI_39826 [Reticulomyxa filosa]|eukprot:ETN97701.1 hypothetical protein RFI_39826 [Reticulomyxa filosa]